MQQDTSVSPFLISNMQYGSQSNGHAFLLSFCVENAWGVQMRIVQVLMESDRRKCTSIYFGLCVHRWKEQFVSEWVLCRCKSTEVRRKYRPGTYFSKRYENKTKVYVWKQWLSLIDKNRESFSVPPFVYLFVFHRLFYLFVACVKTFSNGILNGIYVYSVVRCDGCGKKFSPFIDSRHIVRVFVSDHYAAEQRATFTGC